MPFKKAKKKARDRSAQIKELGKIIRDIRDWQPNVSSDDGDTQNEFGLTLMNWVRRLRKLAVPILPEDIVTRLNEISFTYGKSISMARAKAELDGLVPFIEDALPQVSRGDVPPPNPGLPDNITKDYEEAGTIVELSPRGAAVLLRLCIEKLCIHLGEPGKNLNKDIGALVAKGLDESIQKALDTVRVLGNESVHPGTLDLSDDRQTVKKMFGLVNEIAQTMITIPGERDELYNMLPEDKRKRIDDRDKEAKAASSGSRRAD